MSSYHHIIISSYHHIIISSYHHIIISAYHHIIISSYHHIIISSYHHIINSSYRHSIISSYHHIITWQDEKSICHFLVNSADRPGIWSNCNQKSPKSWDDWPNSAKSGARIFQNFKRLKNREDGSDFDDLLTKTIASLRTEFSKFSRRRKIFRRTDPDRDQRETDPRPQTGPDRTGFRYRSDGPDEHSIYLQRRLWHRCGYSRSSIRLLGFGLRSANDFIHTPL